MFHPFSILMSLYYLQGMIFQGSKSAQIERLAQARIKDSKIFEKFLDETLTEL